MTQTAKNISVETLKANDEHNLRHADAKMAKKEIFNDLNLVIRLNQHIEEISNDTDAAQSLLTKETSFKILAELSSLTTPDPREDARFDHQRTDFLVSDASHLPFHLQGDQSFNEAAALAKRRALRHSTPINDKIAFLWNVARGRKAAALLRTASSKRDGSFKATSEAIDESEYTDMMLLVFKVLREDFVLESAKLQIHCDWEVDSRHGEVLTNEQYFQAIFELVDVWTCDIVEQTYVRFLELLTRRITLRVVVFLDDMKLKLALSDNFDEAVVVKAIPLSTIQKFASVAKIMESQGVRTVGELANADPRVVETQRVAHLNRSDFSREKIGADLQHLLDMFREISQQFQHANYFFHNMVLQRQPDESNDKGEGNGPMAETSRASINGNISSPTRHETIPSGQQALVTSMIGQDGAIHSFMGPTSPQRGLPQSMGSNHNPLGAHSELTASNTSFESSKNLRSMPPRRGLRRINTFHDLSVTETGVIDALKTTYLIEKGISLQKKSDANEILEELGKFGVASPENMTPEEQARKYGELYEMFVLRDGDNIRALAQSVLTRIKMELGTHGIVVNDEDAEAMYDGFFGSIVSGTGEKIVADAKNWVEDSIKHKSSGSYIKHDYYELKSIDEVALLGSQPGDDEFVSLLATDDEDEDIDGEIAGGRSDSPIAKHLSLSRRPSLFRGGDSPAKDAGQVLLKKAGSSIASNLSKMANNDRQESNPTTIGDSSSGETKSRKNSKVQRTQSKEEDNQHIHSKKDEDSKQDLSGSKRRKRSTKAQADPVSDTPGEKSCDSGGDETASQTHAMEDNEGGDDAHVVAANNDTNTSHTNDNASVRPLTGVLEDPNYRRGSTAPLKPGYNSADLDLDPNGACPDEMHVSHDETDRLPQGVGLEYEEEPPPVVEEVVEAPPPRPRTPEPKVPDIVFSGLETGKNASVAARYIQLLGLGNVTVIQPEAELLTQLNSPQPPVVDLLCFDIGVELDQAVSKTEMLCELLGHHVIICGGDEHDPAKTRMIAEECVCRGALYFAVVPIDFPQLRAVILSYLEGSTRPYIIRQRRPTAISSIASKASSTSPRPVSLVSNSIQDATPRTRLSNLAPIQDVYSRTKVMTPPSYDESIKSVSNRKQTSVSLPQIVTTLVKSKQAAVVEPFRPLRVIDEMPGADVMMRAYVPIAPGSPKAYTHKKSPRLSATLKRLLR